MPRTTTEKLDDSINVPVPKELKRRVMALALREPDAPKVTRFARALIKEGVERREKKVQTAATK